MSEISDGAKYYNLMRNALIELGRQARVRWRRYEPSHRVKDHLEERWRLLDDQDIESAMPEQGERIEIPVPDYKARQIFLLPPIASKANIGVFMACCWDFSDESQRGGFRLFIASEDHADPPLTPFVVRFDDMETTAGWEFAHSQLSDSVAPYSDVMGRISLNGQVLPAEIPRLPLASRAEGITSLFVCVLASVYGTKDNVYRSVCRQLRGDSDCVQLMKTLDGKS